MIRLKTYCTIIPIKGNDKLKGLYIITDTNPLHSPRKYMILHNVLISDNLKLLVSLKNKIIKYSDTAYIKNAEIGSTKINRIINQSNNLRLRN